MNPLNLFISYSHKDEPLMEELFEFLQLLRIAGKIDIWNDRAITVGTSWNDEITNALKRADLILFLISPSFLASTYINEVEITHTLERVEEKRARLVPIMLRPCDLGSHIVPGKDFTIKKYQGLPKDMKPVTKWDTHDDAWLDIVNGLKGVIAVIEKEKSQASQ